MFHCALDGDKILRILTAHKGLSIKRKSNNKNYNYQFIFNWFEQADETNINPLGTVHEKN